MATTTTDLLDRLGEEYAASLPRMKKGDRFAGKVLGIDARDGEYSTYPILTVELGHVALDEHPDLEAGQIVSWHVLHSVAQTKLARLAVKPGEKIAVAYAGMRDSRSGTGRYHDWNVATDRPAVAFDWGKFGAQDDDGEPAVPKSDIPSGLEPQVTREENNDIPF